MADDMLELVRMPHRRDPGGEIHIDRYGLIRLGQTDLAYDRFQIYGPRLLDGRCPGPQLQHQLVHALDDISYRHDHVALKLGVASVSLCIPQQQRKLGHKILQVVNYKRRHAVERVEFAGLEQGFGHLNLTEIAGGLPTRSLQQVEHLPIHLDRGARGDQHDETHEAGVRWERDHEPGARQRDEPFGKGEARVAFRCRDVLGEIDDPARPLQKLPQRAVCGFHGIDRGHVPACRRPERWVALPQP